MTDLERMAREFCGCDPCRKGFVDVTRALPIETLLPCEHSRKILSLLRIVAKQIRDRCMEAANYPEGHQAITDEAVLYKFGMEAAVHRVRFTQIEVELKGDAPRASGVPGRA